MTPTPAPAPPGGDDGAAAGGWAAIQHYAAVTANAQAERDAALGEAARARAEVEALRPGWLASVKYGQPDCICDYNPATTEGPERDCPNHGDVRLFMHLLTEASAESARLAAALGRIEALCDEVEHDTSIVVGVSIPRLRAALASPAPTDQEERV